jgi:HPt (histidine-containing phosphotransfer) domain-containing protein
MVQTPNGIPLSMMVGFLARCRITVHGLSAILERGEFGTIQVFGHRLKGTGGTYGMERLTELGSMIETAAADRSSSQLRELINTLEMYLSLLDVAM